MGASDGLQSGDFRTGVAPAHRPVGGVDRPLATPTPATKYFPPADMCPRMFSLLQLGGVPSLPALLAGLLVVALVLLVGRFIMKMAWRIVIIAIIAVAVLWLLGLLGFQIL